MKRSKMIDIYFSTQIIIPHLHFNTMPIIITYDIPIKHHQLKAAMFRLGYEDRISGTSCKFIYFPETTLYHGIKTPDEARIDLLTECKKLTIPVERCVATKWIDWSALCGEPFVAEGS